MEQVKHNCSGYLPADGYGAAVERCEENAKGEFWVDNGEYTSRVNFCPFCGAKAPVQTKIDNHKTTNK